MKLSFAGLSILLCVAPLVLLRGVTSYPVWLDPSSGEICPKVGCCAYDCCGNGTRWDGQICDYDPSSDGWDGTFPPDYEFGCEERPCCEHDCCGQGTYFDTSIECCVSGTAAPSAPSSFPSAEPTSNAEQQECDCPDDINDNSKQGRNSWSGLANKQLDNNCYNYAVNNAIDEDGWPGYKAKPAESFKIITDMKFDCDALEKLARLDKIVDTTNGKKGQNCPNDDQEYCLVALAFRKKTAAKTPDMHWYRKNDDDTWSHKRGGAQPQLIAANKIEGTNFGYDFCRYMCAPWNIKIDGPVNRNLSDKIAKVIRNINSGILNPGYRLTDAQKAEVIKRLKEGLDLPDRRRRRKLQSTVPPADWDEAAEDFNPLFLILGDDEIEDPLRVFNGTIEVLQSEIPYYYDDTIELELYLEEIIADPSTIRI